MIEGHWFTTIGMSPHAVFNTLWAAYLEHDWRPVRIVVFRLVPSSSKRGIRERLDSSYRVFEKWHRRFVSRHKLETRLESIHCKEEDYETYAREFRSALKIDAKVPRAIDITPGRKFASAIGMEIGIEENVDSIFYLHLLDDSYANLSYPQIPRPLVKLIDLKKGVGL